MISKRKKPIKKICSICRRPYEGYGNNAEPINEGRCCDLCDKLVISARINQLKLEEENAAESETI
jgi:hypothetical protein